MRSINSNAGLLRDSGGGIRSSSLPLRSFDALGSRETREMASVKLKPRPPSLDSPPDLLDFSFESDMTSCRAIPAIPALPLMLKARGPVGTEVGDVKALGPVGTTEAKAFGSDESSLFSSRGRDPLG